MVKQRLRLQPLGVGQGVEAAGEIGRCVGQPVVDGIEPGPIEILGVAGQPFGQVHRRVVAQPVRLCLHHAGEVARVRQLRFHAAQAFPAASGGELTQKFVHREVAVGPALQE